MNKIYVLDTSVLLQDAHSIFTFDDNEVVISTFVLNEFISKKKYHDEIGRNARFALKLIYTLSQTSKSDKKITLKNGGTLRIESILPSSPKFPLIFKESTIDNLILGTAMKLLYEEQLKKNGKKIIFVSKDALARVKADVLGLLAEDFLNYG